MDNSFFICSVAQPGEDYELENFLRCQENSGHFMHDATMHKGSFKKVRPGDVAILKYQNKLVAYGEVISVASDKSIPDLGEWNHRIIVDHWIWRDPSNYSCGVGNYGVSSQVKDGDQFATIKQVTASYGIGKCGEIDSKSSLYQKLLNTTIMEKYLSLLRANKNIILHGAPGTGKTFLAKKIAEAMDAEVEFVQFHPNYDYTDFVEGLRPVKRENNSEIGFELRSGIFYNFCERALKNLVDSKKNTTQLEAERKIESLYVSLVDKISNGEVTQIDQRSKKPLYVDVSTQNNIIIRPDNSDRTYTISLARIIRLAETYKTINNLNDITNISNDISHVIGGCHASGYWAVLNKLYSLEAENVENRSSDISKNESVKERNFVFIIDEINRAEISKVLGELFFSIDPGYRGKEGKVRTQYSNLIEESTLFDNEVGDGGKGWFFVPENVYVIGTMNDIDRSVDRMDFAMRRRFAFKEIDADASSDMLDSPDAWGGNMLDDKIISSLKKKMKSLNEAIISTEVGLPKAYQIGGAYYLKYSLYSDAENSFESLWEYHLAPLLTEYLRGLDDDGQKLAFLKRQYDGL